ncbi:Zinc finger, RING-type [Dillenia turbinata]|uniref:RING-type E3 ubiquitin transferase n=1 Tax=Dillenia turbinata TaxID=194707 RepID=A0AAN8VSG4_9MAGN
MPQFHPNLNCGKNTLLPQCFVENVIHAWHFRRSPTGTPLAPSGSTASNGLHPSIIQKFPTFLYSSVKDFRGEKYGLECAICLLEFEDYSLLRLLAICCHVFHQECIDLWLTSHKTCPVCRRSLDTQTSPKENVQEEEEEEGEECEQDSMDDTFSIVINNDNEEDKGGGSWHGAVAETSRQFDERDNVERFSRSHSTGHSIVRSGEEDDKFTLRLPKHVRQKLARRHYWTKSCTEFGEYSSNVTTKKSRLDELSGFHHEGAADKV